MHPRESQHDVIQLLDPLGLDRLEAMAEDGMVGGVEQRFHRRPLAQKCLAHPVVQSGQYPKLRLQG